MVRDERGGSCFDQNLLLRAGLRALGFAATGMTPTAPRIAGHMALRVDLSERTFLVDAGFGNPTPTGAACDAADHRSADTARVDAAATCSFATGAADHARWHVGKPLAAVFARG
jgi:arylamine N-acetyltransferase